MLHTAGRSGLPKSLHRLSSVNCTQRTPAGLPCGIPGIGDEIEGAMQHAPQPIRHCICGPLFLFEMDIFVAFPVRFLASVPQKYFLLKGIYATIKESHVSHIRSNIACLK